MEPSHQVSEFVDDAHDQDNKAVAENSGPTINNANTLTVEGLKSEQCRFKAN